MHITPTVLYMYMYLSTVHENIKCSLALVWPEGYSNYRVSVSVLRVDLEYYRISLTRIECVSQKVKTLIQKCGFEDMAM